MIELRHIPMASVVFYSPRSSQISGQPLPVPKRTPPSSLSSKFNISRSQLPASVAQSSRTSHCRPTLRLYATPPSSSEASPVVVTADTGLVNGAAATTNGQVIVDYVHDGELEEVVAEIATIERQNEVMMQQLSEYAQMLVEASKKLSTCAQSTRIESAKLRKMARLQQSMELKRLADARKEAQSVANAVNGTSIPALLDASAASLSQEHVLKQMMADLEEARRAVGGTDSLSASLSSAPTGAATASPGLSGTADASSRQGQADDGTSVVVSETMECRVAHPGALSCVRTTVRRDDSNRVAVVTMEATVKCDGEACMVSPQSGQASSYGTPANTPAAAAASSSPSAPTISTPPPLRLVDDYVALAVSSLADTSTQLKHSPRFARAAPDDDPRAQKRRHRIEETLAKGQVVSAVPIDPPSKFGHESFVVRLKDPKGGQEVEGMFKPRVEGDAGGWHRAPVEWVAYELNLLLGMDYIPPVAYRRGGVDLTVQRKDDCYCSGDQHQQQQQHQQQHQHQQQQQQQHLHYEEGAFIYWLPDAKELQLVPAANWGVSVARLLSDTRILDCLLNNSDRHHGHFLFGPHWSDGLPRVALIDHAAGFRQDAVVSMDHENAFQTGAVRCVSAHTYCRLRFLDRAMLEGKFKGFLSDEEISGMMRRRDAVLKYLDAMVQERGYHRTVVD